MKIYSRFFVNATKRNNYKITNINSSVTVTNVIAQITATADLGIR